MSPKLEAIAAASADDLKAYVREHEDKILEAWHQAEQEAQDNETAPKFALGFSIRLDLDKDQMETALSWSVKYKASRTTAMPEPNQGKLPLDEADSITIKTDGAEPVTMTTDQWNKAVKRLTKKGGK